MAEGGCGQPPALLLEGDATVYPIHCSGDEATQDEYPHQPMFEGKIGRQREEIKAHVLRKQGIAVARRHLVEETEHDIPVAHLPYGHQEPEETGDPGEETTPRETLARARPQLGQGLEPQRFQLNVYATRLSPMPGVSVRHGAVRPQQEKGHHEDGAEEEGLGAKHSPEDLHIAQGRKPDPIDQQGTGETQEDQPSHENDQPPRHGSPLHIPPPSWVTTDTRSASRPASPHSDPPGLTWHFRHSRRRVDCPPAGPP